MLPLQPRQAVLQIGQPPVVRLLRKTRRLDQSDGCFGPSRCFEVVVHFVLEILGQFHVRIDLIVARGLLPYGNCGR